MLSRRVPSLLICGTLLAVLAGNVATALAADSQAVTIGLLSPTSTTGLFCLAPKVAAPVPVSPSGINRTGTQNEAAKTEPSQTFLNPSIIHKRIDELFKGATGQIRSEPCEPPRPGTLEFRLLEVGLQSGKETRIAAVGGPDLIAGAANLVGRHVSMIVAVGTNATLAARRETRTIPIVMVGVSDPVSLGFASSLRRPGGNVTGVSFLAPELANKHLEFLAEVSPKPLHVGVLWNPENPGGALVLRALDGKAEALGAKTLSLQASGDSEVSTSLRLARTMRVNALLVLPDPIFNRTRAEIFEWTAQERVPSGFQLEDYVQAGGLLSYGPSEGHIYDLTYAFVRNILQGSKPADLPIQQPSKFRLVINLRTAKTLGLTIPPSLLLRADQVIE